MVQKDLPQAWWFDSHNRAKTSRWLSNTLSELDYKTKDMLNLIEQDADSFAQRAEMYYKKRPILVDMLGDLYRTHRSLAEQYDLMKHGGGARHTVFGLSSLCTQQSRSHSQAAMNDGGKATTPASSCSVSTYDSESEVDDPEQEEDEEEEEEEVELSGTETETQSSKEELQQQQEQVELMRAEIERLREQNAALQKVAEENAALRAELAGKDEEKREVIRQLASSFGMMREENRTLRDRIIRESSKSYSSSRAFDLKKVAMDLFSARLFTAHCRPPGPIVAL